MRKYSILLLIRVCACVLAWLQLMVSSSSPSFSSGDGRGGAAELAEDVEEEHDSHVDEGDNKDGFRLHLNTGVTGVVLLTSFSA